MTRRPFLAFLLAFLLAAPARPDGVEGDPLPPDGRRHDFDTKHIRLEMAIDFDAEKVAATATLSLVPISGATLSNVALDAVGMDVRKVEGGGRELGFRHDGKTLIVPVDGLASNGNPIELRVHYVLDRPAKGVYFIRPTPEELDLPRQVYTQSEPDETRYWLPCFDQPDDKVTSETVVTVPSGMLVLSNGGLVSRADDPGGKTTTWHWRQEIPHSVYLIVVTAGDYVKLEDHAGDLPVEYWVAKDEVPYAPLSFGKTPAMIEHFGRITGVPYPYEKYAQITVKRYMWGGMEHTTATTLNGDTIHDERSHLDWDSDGLVAHELAHMWFG
ncbi:MAG: hypothetical protein HY720_20445, partial [Planctomycetes bacterium]|nr:hypothetical protein [Planctomycetota bacterium]